MTSAANNTDRVIQVMERIDIYLMFAWVLFGPILGHSSTFTVIGLMVVAAVIGLIKGLSFENQTRKRAYVAFVIAFFALACWSSVKVFQV